VQSGDADVFALRESLQFGGGVGLIVIAMVAVWMYRVASEKHS